MTGRIVVVGAGQAGAKVAETLRRNGVSDPIVLVGDEPHLPYQRPPLSKKFLLGAVDREALWLQQAAYFATNDIDFRPARRVAAIDRAADRIHLDDGSSLDFGRLILTTGSRARQLSVPGAGLVGIHAVRTLADAEVLHDALPDARSAVIVGGGYIGLETAASLRSAGIAVTVLETQDRLLARAVCPVVAAYLARLHRERGVEIRTGVRVDRFTGSARCDGVALGDGSVVRADLVISAVGGIANDEIAAAAGIGCDGGILVDGRGATSRPNVFAAGDCTRFFSRRYGRALRLESVQNANDQARIVADAIAGKQADYDPVPWFWSDQYDVKLQMAGLSEGYDAEQIDGDPSAGAFAVTYLRGGRPIAVAAIDNARAYMSGRRALEQQRSISTDE